MPMRALVKQAVDAGILLRVEDGRLKFEATAAPLAPALREELRRHRDELVAYLGRLQTDAAAAVPPLRPRAGGAARAPLSYAQERLWFVDQFDGSSAQYNMQGAYRLHGRLDRAALRQALAALVQRHEILRTRLMEEGGTPWQQVLAQAEVALDEIDLSLLPADAQDARVRQALREDAARPFDLAGGSLLRASLYRLDETRHVLCFNMHHIVSDGGSLAVLVAEFSHLYAAFSQGQAARLDPLPLQYADYAVWQRDWLRGEVLEKQLHFWKDYLAGLPVVHSLPLDKPRPAQGSFNGRSHFSAIGEDTTAAVRRLCQQLDVTPFMLLQTALAVLLSRYANESDIVMGTPIAGRVQQETQGLIGLFVNTLVLRTQVDPAATFEQTLLANKRAILDVYDNQHVPFEALVEELKPRRSLAHGPLFQILFNLESGGGRERELRLPGLQLEPLLWDEVVAKFDLEIIAAEAGSRILINWTYNSDLFLDSSVARMAENFAALLAGVVAEPQRALGGLCLLAPRERAQILADSAEPAQPISPYCAFELFEQQAALQPQRSAVRDCDGALSYAELNARANRLAQQLRAQGLRPDDLVALCVSRRAELMVAILAIHKAGAAYVPLDPDYPAERIAYMLEDSRAALVITEEALRALLPLEGRQVICLDAETTRAALQAGPAENMSAAQIGLTQRHLSHIIYTSGSTGRPKGVAIEHRSVTALLDWTRRTYSAQERSRVLLSTSLCFDLSVFEMWSPLIDGGEILVVRNVLDLLQPAAPRPTLINTVPSALKVLLDDAAVADCVDVVNVAGEPLKKELVNRTFRETRARRMLNLYGPSEDTTYSTVAEFRGVLEEEPGIGRALDNTSLYVVSPGGTLCPQGAVGELYIGGAGLARGYLHADELTRTRFIANPFPATAPRTSERLYRTGDLVRRRADGSLQFLGRNDHQVKLHGFRIELGEIERRLVELGVARECVVMAREDGPAGLCLAAYVVAAGDAEADGDAAARTAAAKAALRRVLPDYMVPALFVFLQALPLTANGKIDRKALPAPQFAAGDAVVAPRTPLESDLHAIWSALLKRETLGVGDDFFDIGGHSLLATRLVSAIRQQLGLEVALRELFQHPTIAALAALLEQRRTAPLLQGLQTLDRNAVLPLSYGQQRLWVLDRLEAGSAQYNIVSAFRAHGRLDRAALQAAVDSLVERHEILRTRFVEHDGVARQQVLAADGLVLREFDLSALHGEEQEQALRVQLAACAGEVFDLAAGPLIAVALVRLSAQEHALLFNVHHIICDGWSMGLLTREFAALYAQYAGGAAAALAPLRFQYADYAGWQRTLLQGETLQRELDYWRQRLAGIPQSHSLPLDQPRPPRQSHAGRRLARALGGERSRRLAAACRRHSVTPFVFLHTLLAVFVSRYSNAGDIVIGAPIAGRVHADLEALVGFFVNTLVLRTQVDGEERFDQLLARNQRDILDAYAHQQVPFEMLVEALQPPRSLSHSPLFQILFTFQNTEQQALGLKDLQLQPLAGTGDRVRFDLEIVAEQDDEELQLAWLYNTDLFRAATVERMAENFLVLLDGALQDAARPVWQLPLLAEVERQQALYGFNQTARDFPGALCMQQLFEAQVERSPDAIALQYEAHSLSYRELNARANRLAHHLLALGVRPDQPVGLCLERSLEMVIAIYAVLKAGGAYLPVDPDYPADRVRYMLQDSAVGIVLTQSWLRDTAAASGARVICLDQADAQIDAAPAHNPDSAALGLTPQHLAYVIYTSGSTGRPKGVMVPHGALVNRIDWMQREYALGADDRVLQKTPFSFDVSVWEFTWPLIVGARLVMARPNGHKDPQYLERVIDECGITTLHFVPSMLAQMLDVADWGARRSLRKVFCSGEALGKNLVQQHFASGSPAQLHNLYGPTEAAIDVTYWDCRDSRGEHTIPIGYPIQNIQMHVLDEHGQVVPIGVFGELHIGGVGLARGYLNKPELSAEKFIADPFAAGPGARLYRTGDLARWTDAGYLEFAGRIDHQVKLNGLRIELGEIEAQIMASGLARECVVVARGAGADSRLVAYVVAAEAGSTPAAPLSQFLQRELPLFMVPAQFVFLAALPLSPNGKIDRKALPEAGSGAARQPEYVAPRHVLEQRLCAIWQELLGLERVGVQDNFFDVGGTSLRAIQLQKRISQQLQRPVALVDLFTYPTIAALVRFLREGQGEGAAADDAESALPAGGDIAIIGSACRFPDARAPAEFWRNIAAGRESLQFYGEEELRRAGVPAELLARPDYVRAGVVLDGLKEFDAAYFGFTPREAEVTDPQQRRLLECAAEALDHAGYGNAAESRAVGVFVGAGESLYFINHLLPQVDRFASLGAGLLHANSRDYAATRLSYKLNLSGPSVSVNTACSTALVALHQACNSLRLGECRMALAGAAGIAQFEPAGYLYQEGDILSADGHCRAFDSAASGTRRGHGAGLVLLKRLEHAIADGDTIHAVIKGSALSNDATDKVGFTAPSVGGQARAIRGALRAAGVEAASIGYVEAHGTGTVLGDPIELRALQQAFGALPTGGCAIGSVKSNLGHLDAAAGIAGLIKTVEALKHRQLPPSINYANANPQIDFAASPFYVNTQLREWPRGETPRRAGVSSFGIGGTNAHVVLEEAPESPAQATQRPVHLLLLSAKTPTALEAAGTRLLQHLQGEGATQALADIAYTLQVGRTRHAQRRALVADSVQDAIAQLQQDGGQAVAAEASEAGVSLVLLFPGQGSQYLDMGKGLYESEAEFRRQFDRCAELLQPLLGLDLRAAVYPPAGADRAAAAQALNQTRLAQPALFALEYSLAQCLLSYGLEPEAMIGHSLGEYVAACVAGVFTLEEGLHLVARRAQLMQAMAPGAMLSADCDEATLGSLIAGTPCSLAAVNGARSVVASGPLQAIEQLATTLTAQGITHRPLATSHAFHSAMMEPLLAEYRSVLHQVRWQAPQRAYVSNLSGRFIEAAQATDVEYWLRHLRECVRFAEGAQTLLAQPAAGRRVLLEAGPGLALGSLLRKQPAAAGATVIASLRHAQDHAGDDNRLFAKALGQLWLAGATLDWKAYHAGERRRRVPLPAYPFEGQCYWIDAPAAASAPARQAKRGTPADWFQLPLWKLVPGGARARRDLAAETRVWVLLCDEHGLGEALLHRLRQAGQTAVAVRSGAGCERLARDDYRYSPAQPAQLEALLPQIAAEHGRIDELVHLAGLALSHGNDAAAALEQQLQCGYFSLLHAVRALAALRQPTPAVCSVVSADACRVTGAERIAPEAAILAGLCKVAPQEYAGLRCRQIDLDSADAGAGGDALIAATSAQLLDELCLADPPPSVALRRARRWTPAYEARSADGSPARSLRRGGTYLISGGLGRIGQALALHLARNYAANLVIVSRRALPASQDWARWLADEAADAGLRRSLQQLQDLQQAGAQVLYCSADSADAAQIAAAMDQAEARFGRIDGVIHCAGNPQGAAMAISEATPESVRAQFLPKAGGVLALAQALEGRAVDFCLLMSSLSGVLGGLGFSAYAAANLYLDAFAQARHAAGDERWLSVGWDGWSFAAAGTEARGADAYSMSAAEGVAAFEQALAWSDTAQLINSTGPLKPRLDKWIALAAPEKPAVQLYSRRGAAAGRAAPRDAAEQRLLEIWQELTGVADIGVHDNFFELGGDSLLATRLLSRIRDEFPSRDGEYSMRAFFEAPTIAGAAGKIAAASLRDRLAEKKREILQENHVIEEGVF
ncbi:hybrid non-ribosomal peptide synthetase/type I polyketide synthase [Tahibacter harae]|uniref:Amino acid adenylation domain-containing protein n=1 Tax=Tahibacter harae TaxID=2963937 RepID=A0ABT1QM53_9GAMM|nr:hybrid non-ribosomal peptide synthetase/type I polyketide synthase [Tahibacter harae]MCQ4163603.1 amino acid adenylation domain-containing protein [Tahibacter harae]